MAGEQVSPSRVASAISPISKISTAALIAAQLREAIATGEFLPGQQLHEASLAQRLGVSRGPLREAMQRLTQEGLLVSHRNRGLFVLELDESVVADIYLARTAIERAAVREVIDRAPDLPEQSGRLTQLQEIVAEMAAFDGDPGSPEISRLDIAFHKQLVAASQSPRLALMHDTLLTQVRLCLATMERSFDSVAQRAEGHAAIVLAILAGDADLADRLLAEHLADGLRRLRQVSDG